MGDIPVVDVSALVAGAPGRAGVAAEIGRACREHGFFYAVGHGVDEGLQERLERHSREFFALDLDTKLQVAMARGGRAWRGYFPVGAELTSGEPDLKEGLYFGDELPPDHPEVLAGTPMHGPNLFPAEPPGLRPAVLEYLDAMTALGATLLSGIALSLGLDERYFADRYTGTPFTLFRIFHYPLPEPGQERAPWGVGPHTDYGLLAILKQDDVGGLQVRPRAGDRWLDATPIPNSFVCNIGDMLERLTGGHYVSTPHRVLPSRDRGRLSWPFFFEPNFHADVRPAGLAAAAPAAVTDRWDGASPHDFRGTYGDYILAKVGKVFPGLSADVL
ncbi:MAG TPA: 2-oxoglutarate and iron-dependent oxygenase domain-containing protein [Pseudonocardiaceae bacterium]